MTGGLAERGLHLNSKFESPSYLDVSWSVDDPTSSTGHAEVTVTWPPVDGTKSVPIESIGEVELKHEHLAFRDLRSLDNRNILVHITRTSPPPHYRRQIPENVSAPSSQRRRVGVQISRTVRWRR